MHVGQVIGFIKRQWLAAILIILLILFYLYSQNSNKQIIDNQFKCQQLANQIEQTIHSDDTGMFSMLSVLNAHFNSETLPPATATSTPATITGADFFYKVFYSRKYNSCLYAHFIRGKAVGINMTLMLIDDLLSGQNALYIDASLSISNSDAYAELEKQIPNFQ